MQPNNFTRLPQYSYYDPNRLNHQAVDHSLSHHLNAYSQHPPLPPSLIHFSVSASNTDRSFGHSRAKHDKAKICGWCNTQSTIHWRVGSTTGSDAMKTLCNACGMSYRRAQKKIPLTVLDLDRLAQKKCEPLSIQKELKRQLKNTHLSIHFKRTKQAHRARPPNTPVRMVPLAQTTRLSQRHAAVRTARQLHFQPTLPERSSHAYSHDDLRASPALPSTTSLAPIEPQRKLVLPSFTELLRSISQ